MAGTYEGETMDVDSEALTRSLWRYVRARDSEAEAELNCAALSRPWLTHMYDSLQIVSVAIVWMYSCNRLRIL